MGNEAVLTVIDQDREAALALLRRLKGTQTGALATLSAHANAASAAGNHQLDIALTRMATGLSRENLSIANAKRAVLKAKSLSGPTARLAALITEAEQARQTLDDIAQALEAAARLIEIIRRLFGIFA